MSCSTHAGGQVTQLQTRRRLLQAGFFLLFLVAPPLDLFRIDITQAHVIVFGQVWSLGISNLIAGESSGPQAVLNLVLRGLLPLAVLVIGFGWIAWRYGRLYCGWLCPHFSVVEIINNLMRRANRKPSVWEKHVLPTTHADGSALAQNRQYWWLVALAVPGFAFLWAFVLLTYLLPPQEIYANLVQFSFTRNQTIFLSAATIVLSLEFLLARHLFCRFGCAVGVFQSLVWMANKRGLVVGFDRKRASACATCDTHCEHACPMRLKPRDIKRKMFTCTECGQCIAACEQVQSVQHPGDASLLQWVKDECALDVSARDFGQRPSIPSNCYQREMITAKDAK